MNKKLMLCVVTALGLIFSAHAAGTKRVYAPSPEEVAAEEARNYCEENDVATTMVPVSEREFNAARFVEQENERRWQRADEENRRRGVQAGQPGSVGYSWVMPQRNDLVIVQVPAEYEDQEDGENFRPTYAWARIVDSVTLPTYGVWTVFFGHNDQGVPIITRTAVDFIRVPTQPELGELATEEDMDFHEVDASNQFEQDEPVLIRVLDAVRFGRVVAQTPELVTVKYGEIPGYSLCKTLPRKQVGKRRLPIMLP